MFILMRYLPVILTILLWFFPATAQSAIPQAAAGFNHTLLLKSDGTVWAWGNNTFGQLGNGTTTSSNVPVQVIGLNGVTAIATSINNDLHGVHSVAVKSDGTVWEWGSNMSGQLGNGTNTSSSVPVQVVGLDSVISVTAPVAQTVALKSDGTVWEWGLGLGTPNPRSGYATDALTPLQVTNLSAIVSTAASLYSSAALKSDGTVWTWGGLACNPSYVWSVGLGSHNADTPAQVTDLSGITAVAMTPEFSTYVVAVKSDGTVWQCGTSYYPVTPNTTFKVDGLAGIRSIAAGAFYGLARRDDGTVSTWGIGPAPDPGYVVILPPTAPQDVVGLNGIVSIAAGFDHAVAIKNNGTIWLWGSNTDGQLGNGSNTNSSIPVQALINAGSGTAGYVVEFYNTHLDHYFITADANEAAGIDGGSAGPGWSRTGYTFKSGGDTPVCRFYGSLSPGPNSHFYTVDPGECNFLKELQASTPATEKRWNFESLDFFSTPSTNGACPGGMAPVYRAYNNGFARGVDSNHRITGSPAALQEVVARGWIDEGVVMCAPN